MNILFVCTGNTCRSPMAEQLCRKYAVNYGVDATVSSAGINAHPGDSITEYTADSLERSGITKVAHKARIITKAIVDAATTIFVMEEHHRDAILYKFPEVASKVRLLDKDGVEDPFGQTQAVYDRTLAQIKQSLVNFFETVKK